MTWEPQREQTIGATSPAFMPEVAGNIRFVSFLYRHSAVLGRPSGVNPQLQRHDSILSSQGMIATLGIPTVKCLMSPMVISLLVSRAIPHE